MKKVLLDPGHSSKKPGAIGKNPVVKEEQLNLFQAQVLREELEKLGIQADIVDPIEDNLTLIGATSKDYDGFFSLHLNAFDKKEHYCCFVAHNLVAKRSSLALAQAADKRVSRAMGARAFGNVYRASLRVLKAAELVCKGPCVLSELEFVDDEVDYGAIQERLQKGLKEYAKVISEFL